MKEDFYLFTNNFYDYGSKSFYCVRRIGFIAEEKYEQMYIGEMGKMLWKPFLPNQNPDPFLTLEWGFQEIFMEKLANILANENIKTEKDSKLEGKMEAQVAHLKDLRVLLFKISGIEIIKENA